MATITDKELGAAIKKAKRVDEDEWIRDGAKARGVGRVEFRARPTGECLGYFRYTNSSGDRDRLTIGTYDPKGTSGSTLKQMYAKAAEYSKLYQDGNRDLRAYLAHEDAEERAHMESAARARAEATRQAQSGTLQALLDGYVAHLEAQGKSSARDVRNLFRKNISDSDAFPHLAAMPARQITREDASAMLAAMIERGIGRNVAKLRSYARSAYSCAMEAGGDPTIHRGLHGFNLQANPFAAVSSKNLAKFNRVLERHLSEPEMRAFLKALNEQPGGIAKDVIRLGIFLGGQRTAQLVRARPGDVDMDGGTITLYDPKGARQRPRPHTIPLTERAAATVRRYLELKAADGKPLPYLFTSNSRVPVRAETVWRTVDDICKAMTKTTPALEPFSLRDLRRTCETMLARMGISKDIRAQILSHGLGGVQDRHYDRHHYMPEKRAALERWDAELMALARKPRKATNVVPMRAKRAHG